MFFLLALLAKEEGIKKIYVPRMSANEASVIEGVEVYPVDNLKNLIKHLNGERKIDPLKTINVQDIFDDINPDFDFSEILGQEQAKEL